MPVTEISHSRDQYNKHDHAVTIDQPESPDQGPPQHKADTYFRNKRIHGGTFSNAFMYIDEHCNMHCEHCYLGDRLDNPERMSLKEIAATLDYFQSMGTRKCTIIGGEPTCSKHLIATIRMINDRGFECIIDTNGWFTAEKVLGQISHDALEYIAFSLDASEAEIHDSNRKQGSYERVIKNISYAVDHGFEVRIIPTITRQNQHEAEAIIELAQRLGVKSVNFHTVTMIGNARSVDRKKIHALHPEEWIEFYRRLDEIKRLYNIKIWYPPTYAHLQDIQKFVDQGYRGCVGRTIDRLSVFPGGPAYICSLMFDEERAHGGKTNGYYGVIKERTLEMNSTPHNEIALFFEHPQKCYDCQYITWCRMGCPAERARGQENFCGTDKPYNTLIPMCRLWKAEVLCE